MDITKKYSRRIIYPHVAYITKKLYLCSVFWVNRQKKRNNDKDTTTLATGNNNIDNWKQQTIIIIDNKR